MERLDIHLSTACAVAIDRYGLWYCIDMKENSAFLVSGIFECMGLLVVITIKTQFCMPSSGTEEFLRMEKVFQSSTYE